MKRIAAKTVDAYLSALPEEARATLERVRKSIKAAAPDAEEVISYQIPCFKLDRMLVGFAVFKNHCSFFVMSLKLMADLREELKGYSTAKATIHFPLDKPLSAALIKRIVKARIAENEARAKKKASRAKAKPKTKGTR